MRRGAGVTPSLLFIGGVAMKKLIILIMVLMIAICIYAEETGSAWDINTVKLRKQSLFGWNYYQG